MKDTVKTFTTAEEAKAAGNEEMKARNYEMAAKYYTKAIKMAEKPNYIYYANRSAVYLELEKYDECIADADKSIEIEPTFFKSYFRKAKAYVATKELEQAI